MGAQVWWVNLHPPTAHVPGSLVQSDPVFSEGWGGEQDGPWLGTSMGTVHILEIHTPRVEATHSLCALGQPLSFLWASLRFPSVKQED